MDDRQLAVSVCLCTYNGEAYLGEQLDSILSQTVPPDEVVICDDGSTDATVRIVQDFARRFPAIRLIENAQNLGVARNFEQAIRLATGDLIFLSDQDDVWLPDRLREMTTIFQQHPDVGLVYSRFQFSDHHLQPLAVTARREIALPPGPRTPAQIIRQWASLLACQEAFRASLKPFLLPFPAGWSHDAWIEMIGGVFSEVRQSDNVLMHYRVWAGSTSGNTKYTVPALEVSKTKIKRSDLWYYTDETVRWTGLADRLREIAARHDLPAPQRAAVARFLPEAERRAAFAREREQIKTLPRPRRSAPALRLLLTGQYHRYLTGWRTFAKDVLLK